MKSAFGMIRKLGAGAALIAALGATSAFAEDAYKIGLAVPVTGGAADAGKREAIGANAAVKAINDAGGINGHKVEMYFADTGGNPQDAVNAIRKLTGDDNVLAIVGPHYSGVAEATFPLGNRLGIVQIATASSKPGVAAANRPFAFRNTLTEDKVAEAVVAKLKERYNPKKVAIITDIKDAVSRSIGTNVLPPVLKAAGIEVINEDDQVTFQTGDAQFTAQITKLKAMNPDAVGLGALGPDALNIITEARRQGMTQPFFGTAPLLEGNIPEKGGEGVAGTVAGTIWDFSLQDERSEQFRAEYGDVAKTLYTGEFTARPDYYAVNSYDAVMMIAAAIRDKNIAPGDDAVEEGRTAIKDYLAGLTSFDGVASKGFNDVGDGVKTVHVFEIVDGHWAPMK
ncbi:MAG: ABC transporter substrate-binding protein [Rhodobacteraceae bacterium]|nr:ABC transporter substrate-binding protein [Paracoccaceae bacterium]